MTACTLLSCNSSGKTPSVEASRQCILASGAPLTWAAERSPDVP